MGQTVTARDRVWAWIANRKTSHSWTLKNVDPEGDWDDRPSEETIRRVVKAAEELGVVEHSSGSPYYRVTEDVATGGLRG